MSATSEQSRLPETVEPANVPATEPALWPPLPVRRWLWLLYALAWTTALLVPMPVDPPPPGDGVPARVIFGKTVHIMAYAVFTGLAGWMLLPGRFRWLLAGFLVGHGLLTEYLQYLTYEFFHRTGKWSDVGLDCIGIVLGIALTWKWWLAPSNQDRGHD
jgi:hypothetical protein